MGISGVEGYGFGLGVRSAAGGQRVLDGIERGVGVLPQSRDGADAHHDDQGEHDRVLDRGRAVFGLEELDNVLRELTHGRFSHNSMKRIPRNPGETASAAPSAELTTETVTRVRWAVQKTQRCSAAFR